jgi:hypothetical protein
MRDRLPDLLHERLDASTQALVAAHVDGCVDCRAELALLREARVALSSGGVVSIDVNAITRVVIDRTRRPAARRQRPWMDWRIAASIAVLALGVGSFVTVRRDRQVPAVQRDAAPLASVGGPAPNGHAAAPLVRAPSAPPASNGVAPVARGELSAAGGVSDLSDGDLRALLRELDRFDAVPAADPEPMGVRVSLPGTGSLE